MKHTCFSSAGNHSFREQRLIGFASNPEKRDRENASTQEQPENAQKKNTEVRNSLRNLDDVKEQANTRITNITKRLQAPGSPFPRRVPGGRSVSVPGVEGGLAGDPRGQKYLDKEYRARFDGPRARSFVRQRIIPYSSTKNRPAEGPSLRQFIDPPSDPHAFIEYVEDLYRQKAHSLQQMRLHMQSYNRIRRGNPQRCKEYARWKNTNNCEHKPVLEQIEHCKYFFARNPSLQNALGTSDWKELMRMNGWLMGATDELQVDVSRRRQEMAGMMSRNPSMRSVYESNQWAGTNSVTGERYTRRELENAQTMKRFNRMRGGSGVVAHDYYARKATREKYGVPEWKDPMANRPSSYVSNPDRSASGGYYYNGSYEEPGSGMDGGYGNPRGFERVPTETPADIIERVNRQTYAIQRERGSTKMSYLQWRAFSQIYRDWNLGGRNASDSFRSKYLPNNDVRLWKRRDDGKWDVFVLQQDGVLVTEGIANDTPKPAIAKAPAAPRPAVVPAPAPKVVPRRAPPVTTPRVVPPVATPRLTPTPVTPRSAPTPTPTSPATAEAPAPKPPRTMKGPETADDIVNDIEKQKVDFKKKARQLKDSTLSSSDRAKALKEERAHLQKFDQVFGASDEAYRVEVNARLAENARELEIQEAKDAEDMRKYREREQVKENMYAEIKVFTDASMAAKAAYEAFGKNPSREMEAARAKYIKALEAEDGILNEKLPGGIGGLYHREQQDRWVQVLKELDEVRTLGEKQDVHRPKLNAAFKDIDDMLNQVQISSFEKLPFRERLSILNRIRYTEGKMSDTLRTANLLHMDEYDLLQPKYAALMNAKAIARVRHAELIEEEKKEDGKTPFAERFKEIKRDVGPVYKVIDQSSFEDKVGNVRIESPLGDCAVEMVTDKKTLEVTKIYIAFRDGASESYRVVEFNGDIKPVLNKFMAKNIIEAVIRNKTNPNQAERDTERLAFESGVTAASRAPRAAPKPKVSESASAAEKLNKIQGKIDGVKKYQYDESKNLLTLTMEKSYEDDDFKNFAVEEVESVATADTVIVLKLKPDFWKDDVVARNIATMNAITALK